MESAMGSRYSTTTCAGKFMERKALKVSRSDLCLLRITFCKQLLIVLALNLLKKVRNKKQKKKGNNLIHSLRVKVQTILLCSII